MSDRKQESSKDLTPKGVRVVRLGAPPRDQDHMMRFTEDLARTCEEITSDREIRVVVLLGSTKDSFSMGEDMLGWASRIETGPLDRPPSAAGPIAAQDRPVIAAISGDAIGQGLELALACDMRIATYKSRFGFPHVKQGLIPWDGGTQRLQRTVGNAKAMEMILTGDVIDAQEASRIGLVNRLFPPETFLSGVMDIAREMSSKGPISLAYAKEAINKGMDLTLEQGLRLEADLYFLLHSTKDRTEGIRAFQEKRDAHFKGK